MTHTAALQLPRTLVWLLASAAGLSVANVYYAQPLLDALAQDFGVGQGAIGLVVSATQLGCAVALLLLVPLGDLVRRRRLMLVQLLLLGVALVAVGLARAPLWLLAGMLLVGLLGTAMTQGLIAYAASAASPTERGHVVGMAQSGVVVGLLLARTLSGLVADIAGWRAVYFASAALALLLWAVLWRTLPEQPAAAQRLSYPALLRSMAGLLRHDRVLQVRGMLALLMFAAFSIFWSAMALPLSAAPHALSHTAIGAFGLVGAAGALAAARAGRRADRGLAEPTTGAALAVLLLSWAPLAAMASSLWWLALGIVMLDMGGQAVHVTNQSLVFSRHPEAHGRLVGCYMLFYAAGSGLGAIAATSMYAVAGWGGVCALGAGTSLAALLFWYATLPRAAANNACAAAP
ncbi:MFS transporter [Xylophilus sp. GW821-FHT01B05]